MVPILGAEVASDVLLSLFGTAAVIVTIESGVKIYSKNEALFYGNQFQSSIDYLECVDSEGNIYYIDHSGRMYDENYMPINEVANSIPLSITGAKVNTSTFVAKLNGIIDLIKEMMDDKGVINFSKELQLRNGQPIDYSVTLDPSYINYPKTDDGIYTADLANFTIPAGHIYNVYINPSDLVKCDKDNCIHELTLDTTKLTGDVNYRMKYDLMYNPFWNYLQGNITFLHGDEENSGPSYTCGNKTLDNKVTYRYRMVIESDDISKGQSLGKIKGNEINEGSICINTKKTNLPDIDTYKNSSIAKSGDIDIKPEIINEIVNEGKSLDDVLGSLDYGKDSIEDQIIVKEDTKKIDNNIKDQDSDKTNDDTKDDVENNKEKENEEIKILEDNANSKENYLGKDKRGNDWYAQTLNDGRQVWSEVRKGTIRDGGINDVPHIFNNNTGLKKQIKYVKSIKTINVNSGGDKIMNLDGNQLLDSMDKYISKYNSEINYKEDVTKAIEYIRTNKDDIINNNYDELEGYKLMISLLDSYYNITDSDNIGAFLGEIDLIDGNTTMDPAAWEDWIDAINTVVNNDNKEDNSDSTTTGDSSSLPLATGVIGALGSLIAKKKKNTK